LTIKTDDHVDSGIALVLSTRRFLVVAPSHLISPLEEEDGADVLVDGQSLGSPRVIWDSPCADASIAILEFDQPAPPDLRSIRLPWKAPPLQVGSQVVLTVLDEESERGIGGQIVTLLAEDRHEWITASTKVAPGTSGSPLYAKGKLAAICQGIATAEGASNGNGVFARVTPACLRQLARLSGAMRRRCLVGGASILVGGLAVVLPLLLLASGLASPSDDGFPTPLVGTATDVGTALYVFGKGATAPEVMATNLASAGFRVQTASVAPSDLSKYAVVICHVNAPAPAILEDYIGSGGGVVLLEATPYYLGIQDVAEWLGASAYANAEKCEDAVVTGTRPFSTSFEVGSVVAKTSCVWEGAAAMADLLQSAELIAKWEISELVYAFTNRYGRGRVYYQAQFGGAYEGEEAWTLFLAGTRWAARSWTTNASP
jgi:hypothetical protein